MFSNNLNIFYGRISHDVSEKCYLSQTEQKPAKNTLFTKLKVILEEKW